MRTIPAYTPQPQGVTALWLVIFVFRVSRLKFNQTTS